MATDSSSTKDQASSARCLESEVVVPAVHDSVVAIVAIAPVAESPVARNGGRSTSSSAASRRTKEFSFG